MNRFVYQFIEVELYNKSVMRFSVEFEVEFSHQSYLEYFTAQYLLSTNNSKEFQKRLKSIAKIEEKHVERVLLLFLVSSIKSNIVKFREHAVVLMNYLCSRMESLYKEKFSDIIRRQYVQARELEG